MVSSEETEIYKTPLNRFLTYLSLSELKIITLFIILIFFSFITLGIIISYKWLILSLIWLFLIIPMIAVYIYFFYGLMPVSAINTVTHSLRFDDNNLTISVFQKKDNTYENIRSFQIDYSHIQKIKVTASNLILKFNGKQGFIIIPYIKVKNLATDNIVKILKEKTSLQPKISFI